MKARLATGFIEPPLEIGVAHPGPAYRAFRHLRLHDAEHGIVWLLLDKAGARANTFDEEFFDELGGALDELQKAHGDGPRALVIRSVKAGGFATGADLRMLEQMTDAAAAEARLRSAHALIDRIDALPFTTIAVVHGQCLGGGLELALACDWRIARTDAMLGLPEVRVGLHPGLCGTARLTAQVAPTEAMPLMLKGKPITAEKARAIGLVDVVCEERHIAQAVRTAADGKLPHRSGGASKGALMSIAPARALLARQMEAETAKHVRREHYPAPFALIELWRRHADSRLAMLDAERESFLRLLGTPAARNLMRVFFLREHLKSLGREDTRAIRRVHVVGAGAMGADIAAWCALKGCTVTVEDTAKERLGALVKRAAALFDTEAHGTERQRAQDRLIPDFKSRGVVQADLVIEAAPEKLEIKQAVYARVEPLMRADAILATNTSSIRLEPLAAGLARPERFVGLHFFNPVAKMELVEVVAHERCTSGVLAMARSFVAAIDRLPAPVRSAPGFLVNRALMPYLMEALVLLDEGQSAEAIDAAATDFGMPTGPIELADYVGLDICLDVAERLKAEVEQPLPDIPQWLRDKVARGELGKKTGHGLYEYEHGRVRKAAGSEGEGKDDGGLQDRLILPLLNACVTCLRSGVVSDERVIDGAMVFATGFAPFRGGPLQHARAFGVRQVVERLRQLEREHGARFAPDPGWSELSPSSQPDDEQG
ncbi:enoyl-CoA hydratase/isomerase family protein [Variovorax paradoxus]|nr:enoyl-CoA hydratase/isomerase family protein [Variovorax paradoxus]